MTFLDDMWALEDDLERDIALADHESDEERDIRDSHAARADAALPGGPPRASSSARLRNRVQQQSGSPATTTTSPTPTPAQTQAAAEAMAALSEAQETIRRAGEDLRNAEEAVRSVSEAMGALRQIQEGAEVRLLDLEDQEAKLRDEEEAAIKRMDPSTTATDTRTRTPRFDLQWRQLGQDRGRLQRQWEEAGSQLVVLQENHYTAVLQKSRAATALAAAEAEVARAQEEVDAAALWGGLVGAGTTGGGFGHPTETVVEREVRIAAVGLRRVRQQRAAVARAAREAEAEAEQTRRAQVAAARAGRERALRRLREKLQELGEKEALGRVGAEAVQKRRLAALSEMKASVEGAQQEMVKRNHMRARKLRDKKKRQQEEFEELLEAGLNPYQVFRQRDLDARAERKARLLRDRIRDSSDVILGRMVTEEEVYARERVAAAQEREYQLTFQREMGHATKEAKARAWMVRHNRTGQELLDPTGHNPVYPSEVTKVKDASFGLGQTYKEDPYLFDRYKKKHGDNVHLVEPLMGSLARTLNAQNMAKTANTGSTQDAQAVAHLPEDPHLGQQPLLPATDGHPAPPRDLAQPEFAPVWEQHGAGPTKTSSAGEKMAPDAEGFYPPPRLSKLEKSIRAQRLAEHKETVRNGGRKSNEPVKVTGRIYRGEGLTCTPKILLFQDFEVGQTYDLKVSITNVFWSKNSFRVAEIPAHLADVLEWIFDPPGELSAGITHPMTLRFRPKKKEDVDADLLLLTAAGPVALPLRCRTKRALLHVTPSRFDLLHGAERVSSSHKKNKSTKDSTTTTTSTTSTSTSTSSLPDGDAVMIGRYVERVFYVVNEGALPTEFRIDMAHGRPGPEQVAEGQREDLIQQRSMHPHGLPVDALRGPDRVTANALAQVGVSLSTYTGTVGGYSRVPVKVFISPVSLGRLSVRLRACFKVPSEPDQYVADADVDVNVDVRHVPARCEAKELNVHCLLEGHVYTEKVVVRNMGAAALKCTPVAYPAWARHVEIEPNVGYVQGKNSFTFTVKLEASRALLDDVVRVPHAEVHETADGGSFALPLRFSIAGQPLPATCTLVGAITTPEVTFDPPRIHFGDCNLGEVTSKKMTMTNRSRLPQKIGFVRLYQGLSVGTHDNFLTLMPGETRPFVVGYSPDVSGKCAFDLDVRSHLGATFHVPCTAMAHHTTAKMIPNALTFYPTPLGTTAFASTVLTNTHATRTMVFEFLNPPATRLSVTPAVGSIPPRGKVRVEVVYTPRVSDYPGAGQGGWGGSPMHLDVETWLEGEKQKRRMEGGDNDNDDDELARILASGAAGAIAEEGSRLEIDDEGEEKNEKNRGEAPKEGEGEEAEPEVKEGSTVLPSPILGGQVLGRSDFTLACSIRLLAEGETSTSADAVAMSDPSRTIHLQVETTATAPSLLLGDDPKAVTYDEDEGCYVLEYGHVALGQRVLRSCTMVNRARHLGVLRARPLSHTQTFELVSAPRPLGAGEAMDVKIAFCPPGTGRFREVLTWESDCVGTMRIALVGVGIAPSFTVETPTTTSEGGGTLHGTGTGTGTGRSADPVHRVLEGLTLPTYFLGDVEVGKRLTRPMTVTNTSPFAVKASLSLTKNRPYGNVGGLPVLVVKPSQIDLAPGAEAKVKVVFSPDHESDLFENVLSVTVPFGTPTHVPLCGRAWNRGMYVTGGDRDLDGSGGAQDPFKSK